MDVMQWKWSSVALRGVAALAFGVLALTWSAITLHTLVIIFGIFALVDGMLEGYNAMTAKRQEQKWFLTALRSLIGIVIGIVSLAVPGVTGTVFLALIGIWAILSGVGEIVIAIKLPLSKAGQYLLEFGGLISLIFGIIMLSLVNSQALDQTWLIGIYALVFGVVMVCLAVQIRTIQKQAVGAGGGKVKVKSG
jgi:uncharacterized membrane protein HdeD (DUF308 family)